MNKITKLKNISQNMRTAILNRRIRNQKNKSLEENNIMKIKYKV